MDEVKIGGGMAAVIEVLGRDGQVRAVHKISQWPARIGRSPACAVVLDDSHLAAEHAELLLADAVPTLRLLPSLNGGWLGERRLQAGDAAALAGPALFQLGATQLRWRSSADALPAEQPLQAHQQRAVKHPAYGLPVLLAVWLGLLWLEKWLEVNPGSPWVDYASAVLGPLGAVLVWAAVWSLITQLFQHRFPFATHLRRVVLGLTGLQLLGALLPLLAFAFSWPRLMAVDALLLPLGGAALLWWHASLVWPRARRGLAYGVVGLLVGATVLSVARRQEQQHWFGPAYLSVLPPPAVRLVDAKPTAALIDALRPLEAELARQAAKDNEQSGADGDD